jgi:hypothetical protein
MGVAASSFRKPKSDEGGESPDADASELWCVGGCRGLGDRALWRVCLFFLFSLACVVRRALRWQVWALSPRRTCA